MRLAFFQMPFGSKISKSCNRKCLVTTVIKYQNSLCRKRSLKTAETRSGRKFHPFDEWSNWLNEPVILWTELGTTFEDGNLTIFFGESFFGTLTPSEQPISPPFTPSLIYAQYSHLVDHCKNVYGSAIKRRGRSLSWTRIFDKVARCRKLFLKKEI